MVSIDQPDFGKTTGFDFQSTPLNADRPNMKPEAIVRNSQHQAGRFTWIAGRFAAFAKRQFLLQSLACERPFRLVPFSFDRMRPSYRTEGSSPVHTIGPALSSNTGDRAAGIQRSATATKLLLQRH